MRRRRTNRQKILREREHQVAGKAPLTIRVSADIFLNSCQHGGREKTRTVAMG